MRIAWASPQEHLNSASYSPDLHAYSLSPLTTGERPIFFARQGISRPPWVFWCGGPLIPASSALRRERLHLVNDELQRQLPELLPRLWRFGLLRARGRHEAAW